MYVEIFIAVLTGFFAGAAGVFHIQRRERKKELEGIVKLTEDILNEREIKAVKPGEETLYSKAEHHLVRVQELWQGRRDAAEKSRDEIQKLISETAHQMRTPLTNIETYLGFLREMTGEDKTGELFFQSVSAIEDSAEKLHFLVENFIKMSRLEQRIIQIKKQETDILKTIRNALGQILKQAEDKEIQFELTLPERAVLRHDSNWLGEAVYNILDNAVKYSEHGGRIEITLSENEMFLKLRIRDYGIGIEPGEESQIFGRFYRGKRVTAQEGFGIGLYLAREIVDRHDGFLVVKRMDKGLLVEMNLPSGLLEVC